MVAGHRHFGIFFTIVALVNYYTRDLHGSALMPQDILNLGTAAEVMGSYTLKINRTVLTIGLLVLPVLAVSAVQWLLTKNAPKRASWTGRGVRVVVCAACIFCVLFFGYFGPNPIKPKATYGWAWQETYYKYGYLAGTIEATSLMADPIVEPGRLLRPGGRRCRGAGPGYICHRRKRPGIPGHRADSVRKVSTTLTWSPTCRRTPISCPVTKNLQNAVLGHTVSPHVGGGTNNSEYEMLSSNSMTLMPSITPFNWLNLYGANSLVSYTKSLGYTTMAAHPYTNSNYRRDSAWRALGFDETHFQEDFPTQEYYGDRPYQTDSASYRDFEAMYEAMPEDQPRFAFLVSIQSHGDYDMNDASQDIVHARHRLRRVRRADGRVPQLHEDERRRRGGTV